MVYSKLHIAYLNRAMASENLVALGHAEKDYQAAVEIAPQWRLPIEGLKDWQRNKLLCLQALAIGLKTRQQFHPLQIKV